MKLSKLVFECVRDSITLPNSINYISFINGAYDNNKDYVNQISGVFGALNLALSRLFDSNKTLYSTKEVNVNGNQFEFNDGDVVNVVQLEQKSFKRLEFRNLNQGKLIHILDSNAPSNVVVEYKPKIPHFDIEDMKSITLDEENKYIVKDNNIELEEFGISDNMCPYIKEFVKAQLTEFIDPNISNNHNNRAEQYFQGIRQASTSFYQSKVAVKEKIWL